MVMEMGKGRAGVKMLGSGVIKRVLGAKRGEVGSEKEAFGSEKAALDQTVWILEQKGGIWGQKVEMGSKCSVLE